MTTTSYFFTCNLRADTIADMRELLRHISLDIANGDTHHDEPPNEWACVRCIDDFIVSPDEENGPHGR